MATTSNISSPNADEKRAQRIDRWRHPQIDFVTPEAKADYEARVDRVLAALELRVPDRVPVNLNAGFWPGFRKGMTPYDVMHDTERANEAWLDFNLEFQPDTMLAPLFCTVPSSLFEALDYKLYSWPGHGVAKEAGYQYNEKEWMLADEYDHLISDPSDYLLRTYLPRTVGAFSGFGGLSSLFDFIELPFVANHVAGWGSPEVVEGLERLATAARAVHDWGNKAFPALGKLMALGFPGYAGGGCKAPFDTLGDTLRGTRGIVVDLYRQPEKVIAACDRLVQVTLDWMLKRPGALSTPLVFMPLHKGADGFMSDEQFKTFYWPSLRAVLLGLIEEGLIPFCFAEGRFGSRLEIIMDLPKGKTVWLFDQTDMARAKETIGTVACIEGNVPLSLIHAGTPQEVATYTRRLIDTAGVGGGYILNIGAYGDTGRDENLKAMVDTAREYGVY